MNRVFADTSYYIALLGERDRHHAQAVVLAQSYYGQIITTDYVLLEVGNWLSRTADRPLFVQLLKAIDEDPHTTVVPGSRRVFDQGRALFVQRMDKDWSLTDCISFAVMRREKLVEALTADHHFVAAGFQGLAATVRDCLGVQIRR